MNQYIILLIITAVGGAIGILLANGVSNIYADIKKTVFSERHHDTFSKNDNELPEVQVSDNIFFADMIAHKKMIESSRW